MEDKVAQATVMPNSGASDANDFQPTTQNPQTVPGNVFQQQGGVQNVTNTQELLGDQQNARITVTAEPAPQPAAAKANESPLGFFMLMLLITVAAILLALIIRRKQQQATSEPVSAEPAPAESQVPKKAAKAPSATSAKATKPAKKKAVKKQKRKRR